MAQRFNPKSEALAFRFWAWAKAREWNCTLIEVAEGLNVSPQTLGNIARSRGWLGRLRAGEREIGRSVRLDGRRVIDGIAMIGMDGLEAMGAHYDL